jgi:hypothetical protein
LDASARATRQATIPLLLTGCVALVASALGQSAIAALAEAMNTITAAGQANGRTVFQLHVLPHVAASVAAYIWSAAALTFHAVCVSVLFDEARGMVVTPRAAPNEASSPDGRPRQFGPLPRRPPPAGADRIT